MKKKIASRFLKGIFIIVIVGVAIVFLGYQYLIHTPEYKKLATTAYDSLANMDKGTFRKLANSRILDVNGNVIGEIKSGDYKYTNIENIPLHLQNAYIAAEDQNFKTHRGVDYKGLIRAGVSLIKNKGKITQGGSTITQQVIKNNLLTQEQSFKRKFLEILIAPELEKTYSKQEIMEFYCNSNYYGNGCYGVANAAEYYFGKDIKDITVAESAMIAGISNSPNNYNPVASIELANKKKNSILDKMLDQGILSKKEHQLAKEQEIIVTKTEHQVTSDNNYMSSYAIHCGALKLMEKDKFKFQYTFTSQEEYDDYQKKFEKEYKKQSALIRGGGFTLKTSFQMDLQEKLQYAIDDSLKRNQETQEDGRFNLQGAGVCVDNETGYVVAIVGGRGTEDQFNRGFLAKRQPGSTIKPLLVYAPVFDKGIGTPSSIYTDQKVTVGNYSPKNANRRYLGDMNVREALARSTNTIAFQLYNELGSENAMKYLDQMHFSSMCYADNHALSLALGGFTYGVRVDEMAKAYSTIANQGKYTDKKCIVEITHDNEGLLYQAEKEKEKQVYGKDSAFMITDAMQGVFKESYGTGKGIDVNGHIIAGKTGTTNSNRDTWLCGFSKYYTTAVWVGKDNNEVLNDTSYSGTIWKNFMKSIHDGKEIADFTVPDTIEYRNVIDGGKLGDEVYTDLDTSKYSYDRRPKGYDLYSTEKNKKLEKYQAEQDKKRSIENGKKAVAEFEAYEVIDAKSAINMEKIYADSLQIIENVLDASEQTKLKEKLLVKYGKLKEACKIWKDDILTLKKDEEERVLKEQTLKDEQNKVNAVEALHKKRINNMEQYIKYMKTIQYNTASAKEYVDKAWYCLENCKEYTEYSSLKAQYENELKRIQSLPTELPKPEIPENEHDKLPEKPTQPENSAENSQ